MSNGCVKHASSHTYTSVKPPTVNRKTHGMELKRLLFLEPFHLTLGSKSLQIDANPLRTGSSHHYGHQRPMCWSWCHSCISFSSEVVPFPSSEPVVPRSQCASPLLQQPEPSRAQQSPGWQQHLLPWPWLCHSSALGHWCQGRAEQNVAPSRNAQLCRVTRLSTKIWAKPTATALQTGFIHLSNLYLSTKKIITGRTRSLCATACLRSNVSKCCFW